MLYFTHFKSNKRFFLRGGGYQSFIKHNADKFNGACCLENICENEESCSDVNFEIHANLLKF